MGYVIKDNETKGVKKALPKYGSFSVKNEKISGKIEIIGYRKYSWGEEVDVRFTGKIYVRFNNSHTFSWMDASIISDKSKNVSKIKVNRFIKRYSFTDIKTRMNYFGVNVRGWDMIKKIKWI